MPVFSIPLSGLNSSSAALSTIANNLANLNTVGYSRQRAELEEGDVYFNGSAVFGTGVLLARITSVRDRILELRMQDELQQQGSLQAQVSAMSDIDLQFSLQSTSLGDALNTFFNSLSSIGTDPSNISLRQSVLMSAESLANQFRSTSNLLHQRQFSLDLEVQQAVAQVNEITNKIADLNQKISSSVLPEEQLGSYVDQRSLLLQNLSSLLGNHVTIADDGLTVTADRGTPLVVGFRAYKMDATNTATGGVRVSVGDQDITDSLSGGGIHGLLRVRQQTIPAILSNLDAIASNLITSFNRVHRDGFDLDGNNGEDFFSPAPADGSGSAASFDVNITDPRLFAGSGDRSTGSNSNVNALVALRDQPLVAGQTLIQAYSSLTFLVGSRLSDAKSGLQNADAMVQQLTDQRGAISGVSLDEEAANLIRYQRAYEAAARVLNVISELTEVSVNLGS